MATTVNLIITRALRLLSQLNSGVQPTISEQGDALSTLNAMIDSWRNDRLMCYALQEEAIPLTQGVATYTIGPTGALVTTRPVKIESARVDAGGGPGCLSEFPPLGCESRDFRLNIGFTDW